MILRVLCFIFMLPIAASADIAGSADHPLVGRFEGSEITQHDFRDFDEYRFFAARPPAEPLKIEGVTTRIAYNLPPDVSLAEVARNFQLGLNDKGFEIVWECETDDCGGGDLGYALDLFPIPFMGLNIFSFRYLAAKQAAETGEVYVTVAISDAEPVQVQVTVVETAPLQNNMIDAKGIRDGLLESGRVALYGILFDLDKADIKPESAPTLEEIASFLSAEPELAIVIVGHTDNQGSMDYNLDLSHRRAISVRQALISSYGIDGGRMTAAGAGFLAPVAPNATDAGRALNRRVEIIAR